MRVLLEDNPLAPNNFAPSGFGALRSERPAWIVGQKPVIPPQVSAFRLQFNLEQDSTIRVHVSADERYILYLNGQCIGRGPERGSDRIWFYETHDLDLSSGSHTLVALVWQLGDIAPGAQIGLDGGFLLEAEPPYTQLLSTKSAAWETKIVDGIRFDMPEHAKRLAFSVQPIQTTDGTSYPWGVEFGAGDGWIPAIKRHEDFLFAYGLYPKHYLQSATLPEQVSQPYHAGNIRYVSDVAWDNPQIVLVSPGTNISTEQASWQLLLNEANPLVIPPQTTRQIIIDLEDYICGYAQIRLSGGKDSQLTIGWAEALHLDASGDKKGQRNKVEGLTFIALGRDTIISDGGDSRLFEPLWWRSGRFVQILIETSDQPLSIEGFSIRETRYPLEMQSHFTSDDSRLESVTPIMLRGLQMCAHETYMDCPYYEQLMYVGDTRLEALATYVISRDDRLSRKSIALFEQSRLANGFIQARYPSRDIQVIPPFVLWWIGMVYDYALWRGDHEFTLRMLPGIRAALEGFLSYINLDNLLQSPTGWNFADWTSGWTLGVPPDGFKGISGIHNWHLVYTLGLASKLEEWVGEDLLAQRWQGWQCKIAASIKTHFWNEKRGLFADDLAHNHYSEHTQCFALLSGMLEADIYRQTADNLLSDNSLTQSTIYFTHYLFETFYQLRKPEAFFKRMQLWFDLPSQGFKTTPEQPEPSRSDCHGWGAHPLYHYFTTLLGIRPVMFGFEQVEIAPLLGHLTHLTGRMIHPKGEITVDLNIQNDCLHGTVTLPAGIQGVFKYEGKAIELQAGTQEIYV